MHFGRPITEGTAPERWTIRMPFEFASGTHFKETGTLTNGEALPMRLAGHDAVIEKWEHYFVLLAKGFATDQEANAFLNVVAHGFLLLAARKCIAIGFSAVPTEIETLKNQA